MPEVRLEGIHLDGPGGRPTFRGVDLLLEAGRSVLLRGGSAYARGQLLRLCGGLTEPSEGRVLVSGIQLWPGEGLAALKGRARLGLAFGRGGLLANLSLAENLEVPLLYGTALGRGRIHEQVREQLDRFDLRAAADLRPHLLDARATRLANLMRVRLLDPEIILLDEPMVDLDAKDRVEVRTWLEAWAQAGDRILVLAADDPDPRAYPKLDPIELKDGRLLEAA
jgi:ABC-type transporter Mla maintaining outer membrane lipid asymmetry ATPase subunit MlaF